MALTVSTVVFWLIALMTVSSAVVVAGAKNILHAAFALCMTFLGVGAVYVFLHADFVAAVQLIVYVGGILVLIMFAVMFSSNVVEDTNKERRGISGMLFGGITAVAVFALVMLMINRLEKPLADANKYASVDYANTIGIQPDSRTLVEIATDNELLAKNDKIINPGSNEKGAVKPANQISDDELKARVEAGLGEAGKEDAKKVLKAWDYQKSRQGLGHKLVGEYLLPFEVASILLLAALLGAVVIVRKELT